MFRLNLITVLVCLSGCGDSGGDHVVWVGGVSITVRQPDGKHSWVRSSSEGTTIEKDTATGLQVGVVKDRLYVDGIYWCDVGDGDRAVVENGEVTLNGAKLVPPP